MTTLIELDVSDAERLRDLLRRNHRHCISTDIVLNFGDRKEKVTGAWQRQIDTVREGAEDFVEIAKYEFYPETGEVRKAVNARIYEDDTGYENFRRQLEEIK